MSSKDSESGKYGAIPTVEPSATASTDVTSPELKNALIAELMGTYILVQVGCAGLCVNTYLGSLSDMFAVGAIWALGATMAIYISAAISGGHLNPGVTLSFALVRREDFPIQRLFPYWVAQLCGAMLAGAINLFLFHVAINRYEKKHGLVRGDADAIESASAFGDYWSLSKGVSGPFHAFFIEACGTAFLCFVIFAATHVKNPLPSAAVPPTVGIAIGMMVATLGGLTGAGINPARDLGPRLVTLMAGWGRASFTNWIVYIVGPLVGGPVGAFIADKVLMID